MILWVIASSAAASSAVARSASSSRISSKVKTSRRRSRSSSVRSKGGSARPSPVRSSAMSRSHERSDSRPQIPWVNNRASILFSMRSLSWMRCSRSRCGRFASSSSGVDTRTMLHTCRSPPSQATRTRSMPSASSASSPSAPCARPLCSYARTHHRASEDICRTGVSPSSTMSLLSESYARMRRTATRRRGFTDCHAFWKVVPPND
jgi:hypothetical protein